MCDSVTTAEGEAGEEKKEKEGEPAEEEETREKEEEEEEIKIENQNNLEDQLNPPAEEAEKTPETTEINDNASANGDEPIDGDRFTASKDQQVEEEEDSNNQMVSILLNI